MTNSSELILSIQDSIDALSDEGYLGEIGSAFGMSVLHSLENTGIDFDSVNPALILDLVTAHSEMCVLVNHFAEGSKPRSVH
jgi:hypothetical protein